MQRQHRNVIVLSGCQAALQTVGTLLIATGGLSGLALASDKSLATVPLTCYVLGSAIATVPASLLMGTVGRRTGLQLGCVLGAIGSAVCAYAVYLGSLSTLCAGMALIGMHTAFGKYYRFAAADAAGREFKARAISLTLAGGIVGGIFGPEIATRTANGFPGYEYAASFLVLVAVCLGAALALTRLDIPKPSEQEQRSSGRPLALIVQQPAFVVAALAAMSSYGTMNLMMTATPLAMRLHDHPFHDAAFVLQWHVIGMFAPSFFTGTLIQRFGVLAILFAGAALMLGSVAVALAGIGLMHFWLSLLLLGIGWNFMYVGGTTLLTECHTPAERAKTQAANDFMVFATMAISSASSGLLLDQSGWEAVGYGSIPFLLVAMGAIVWLMHTWHAARRADLTTRA